MMRSGAHKLRICFVVPHFVEIELELPFVFVLKAAVQIENGDIEALE